MSVQAHEGSYCTPRVNNADFYTEAEVGFPSERESMLMEYCESPDTPTDTVYGWVPRQVIINVIAKHGGMVEGGLPAGFPLLMVNKS
tara:strand:- start:41 stop:301 length:261 start_codon:yes stop_codon:yes gene_type:complete